MRLSLQDAAHLLQVSERTIRRWIDSLSLPVADDTDGLRFERNQLIAWADEHSFRLAMDVPGEEDTTALCTLAEAVVGGGVHYEVRGRTVTDALWTVSDRLELPLLVDRRFFHQVLLAREDLGSTGVGDGVAIPHVRRPLVLHIEHPLVGIFFLEHPVDWGALDGKPVDTLFVLVSPGVRPHLHLLSRIGFVLRDARLRTLLVERAAAEGILDRLRELDDRVSASGG